MKRSIVALLADTERFLPGNYLENLFRVRTQVTGQAVGSHYPAITTEELRRKMEAAEWIPYQGDTRDICLQHEAWQAEIPGIDGVIELRNLEGRFLHLRDTRGLGYVQPVVYGVPGREVAYTTLITRRKQGVEVVATFHPGRPIIQAVVRREARLENKPHRVQELLEMGFKWAQISECIADSVSEEAQQNVAA